MGRWLFLVLFVLCGCSARDGLVLPVPVSQVPVPLSSSVESSAQSPLQSLPESFPGWAVELLSLHNGVRVRAGLGVLVLDEGLCGVAQLHAQWMARSGVLRHQSLSLVRGSWVRLGENIACGQGSVGEVFRDWWNSRGHRGNVLGDFSRVGFGVCRGRSGRLYWCVVFGREGR